MRLGGLDDVVEALEAVRTRVDGGGIAGEGLEPDGAGAGRGRNVVEAPDAEDFETG